MKDLISHQLVKYLEARGVEHVFGLCGHTNIAVLAAMEKSRIEFVNVRHEQIAAHMADGYARAKRQTAVVLSHLGPGLTNAATGVANASLDSIPMVVIAGDVPTHYHGKHPHQEVNLHADASQYEIYRPFVKRAWRVDQPHLFPEIIEKAFALAESGRPGPVLVDVPMDIFSKEIETELFERLSHNVKSLRKPSLDEATAAEIDIDPAEIGRNYPVEIGAVADLKPALSVLSRVARELVPEGVRRPALASQIAAVRAAFIEGNRKHAESDAYPMRPERILADVRRALPRDALITTDVGWNKNGVGQQFPILEPGTIFTPGGYATMGFGAPAGRGP